jgi:trehalose 6-phosphate synthase/phosphatase
MNRVILVSNRLSLSSSGPRRMSGSQCPLPGGLVSALGPVLRGRGGTWIGWPGVAGDIPDAPFVDATRDAGYDVVPVAFERGRT